MILRRQLVQHSGRLNGTRGAEGEGNPVTSNLVVGPDPLPVISSVVLRKCLASAGPPSASKVVSKSSARRWAASRLSSAGTSSRSTRRFLKKATRATMAAARSETLAVNSGDCSAGLTQRIRLRNERIGEPGSTATNRGAERRRAVRSSRWTAAEAWLSGDHNNKRESNSKLSILVSVRSPGRKGSIRSSTSQGLRALPRRWP